MKIGVISDTHFGFGYGSEIADDSFRQAEDAIDMAIAEGVDLILLPGDIFDSRIPRQEVWARALRILQKPLLAKKSDVSVERLINKDGKVSQMALSGIPIVAIHGTHERRGTHSVNPVEMLEHGGYLIHLHCQGVVFEKNSERVCIYGFSGVPEQYARDALKEWNPKPLEDCKNILVIHQSLSEYIPSDEGSCLSIGDLPKGFDLYINGHIHWSDVREGKKRLLLPGSTIVTQQRKNEAEHKKGFYIVDTDGFKCSFVGVGQQRPYYYREFAFKDAAIDEVVTKAREYLERVMLTPHEIKPQVAIKLSGSLESGKESSHLNEQDIKNGFDAIISINNDLTSADFKKKIEQLRQIQQSKMSVEEMGLDLINKLLADTKYKGIPPGEILDALADGENDEVIKKVLQRFEKVQS
jgi:DNA repair exonuclease SbcCD nuclease subunit